MKTEQIPGAITVTINETDLISREFDNCYDCALACAVQRTTGKFPSVSDCIANLYDTDFDRQNKLNPKRYSLEPFFEEYDYKRLRAIALNHQKVFHTITLIPA